jgi:hypothetical protein
LEDELASVVASTPLAKRCDNSQTPKQQLREFEQELGELSPIAKH